MHLPRRSNGRALKVDVGGRERTWVGFDVFVGQKPLVQNMERIPGVAIARFKRTPGL